MSGEEIKLIMVSQKVEEGEPQEVDPLEQEILGMKMTANLLKQMSFNSTVNKFDYFEKLLNKQSEKFNGKLRKCSANQKQLVKKMKQIQKQCKDNKNPISTLNYAKVHVQLQELRTIKEEAIKYQKLSQGMIKCLEKIDQKLSKI